MQRIKAATLLDLPGAYRVCLLTGDVGEDASASFRNPDLLGHVYVGPYLVGQLEHALVVADAEGVAGYCLAAPDTRAFEAWAEAAWWPVLREQYPIPDDASRDAEIIRLFHAPTLASEAVLDAFPANLHIDLLPRARGRGFGRDLIERQLASLRRGDSRGVHLEVGTDNVNAVAFYRHLGFEEVDRLETSMLMGRRLDARRILHP